MKIFSSSLLILMLITFTILFTACRTVTSNENDVTKNVDDAVTEKVNTLCTDTSHMQPESTASNNVDDKLLGTESEEIIPEEIPVEVNEPMAIGNQFEDYFCYNSTLYVKVSPDDLYDYNREYKQKEKLGEILYNEKAKFLDDLSELAASTLPIGTKLYYTDYSDIILADHEGNLIPYLALIEG